MNTGIKRSQSLQDLIDRYNSELMSMTPRSSSGGIAPEQNALPASASAQPARSGQTALPEAERASADASAAVPTAVQARQQAEPAAIPAATQAEREQWVRDLEQGLAELRQGLIDLEEGRRQMREGQLEYERAIAERKKWEQYAADMAAERSAGAGRNSMIQAGMGNTAGQQNGTGWNSGAGRNNMTEMGMGNTAGQQNGADWSAGAGIGRMTGSHAAPPESDMAFLRVVATTARQAEPVAGAHVSVTRETPKGTALYASVLTDISGRTPELMLPVDKDSEYTAYDVGVHADGFEPLDGLTAQMTSGSASTLRASLEPLPSRR